MSKASGQAAWALDVHFSRERRMDLILSLAPSLTTRLPLYIANHSASCKLGNICFSGLFGRHQNCVSAIQRSPCTF